jgi:hypothetical protein
MSTTNSSSGTSDPAAAVTIAAEKGAKGVGQLGALLGIALIVQGIMFFILTGQKSMTAAIPAFVGIPLLLSSFLMMQNPSNTKQVSIAAHVAVTVSLLGFLGGAVMGILGIVKTNKPSTTVADCLIMAAFSLIHVVASVRHFIKIAGLKRAAKAK